MSSGKRKKRIRKDWLLMSWLAAAAVALGLFLALGMNALLPTYENKVLPLEKELLAPAPVYEAIEETLTLYPWNLYDAARVSSLSESDKAALGVRLWQIFDWLYICLSEDQNNAQILTALEDTSQPAASMKKGRDENDRPLYYLANYRLETADEKGVRSAVWVDCVFDYRMELVYFHYRTEPSDTAYDRFTIQQGGWDLRQALSDGEAEGLPVWQQLKNIQSNGWLPSSFTENDLYAANALTTDSELLLVCTSKANDGQLILMLDPLRFSMTGFSLQQKDFVVEVD